MSSLYQGEEKCVVTAHASLQNGAAAFCSLASHLVPAL